MKGSINNSQKALLHVAKAKMRLSDELYRDILEQEAGVRSALELDNAGMQAVMRHLEACGFKRIKDKGQRIKDKGERSKGYYLKWKRMGVRPGMATAGQLAKIEHLWDDAKLFWDGGGQGDREKALRGFLRRFHCDDLRFLKFESAFAVIEALKKIGHRRRGKK